MSVSDTESVALKLLLVAESSARRDALTGVLKQASVRFEIDWADGLADASERVTESRYECLLVDMRLADEELVELVDTLRELAVEAGIVVLTGRADDALGRRVLRHGADDYLLETEQSSRHLERAIGGAVERAAARTKIRELSARSLAVLKALGDGVIVLDAERRVSSANPAAVGIVGIAEADLIGRPVTRCTVMRRNGTVMADEDRPALATLGNGQSRNNIIAGFERDDGEEIWVEASTYPLRKTDGSVDGAVVLLRDIRDRLAADETTRFQAALLAAAGQAVVVTDATGRILFWNPAAETMHGWTSAEVLGQPAVDFRLTETSAEQIRDTARALTAGKVWSGDVKALRRDGTRFPALVTAAPVFDDRAELVAVIVLSTDISERKQAEETAQALSAIVTSSADAIFTKALDGTILTWNRGAERLYGYRREDVIGQHVSLLDPDPAHAEVRSILATVAAGETIRGLETVRRHRDGSQVHVSLTVSPIFGESDAVVAASVIGRDISERKQGEVELTRQMLHDSLTGLPNRALLADRLSRGLSSSVRHGVCLAVLFVDLDQFKAVNDAHGYHVGDELLIEVGQRLSHVVGTDADVARFGGDEFVIVAEVVDSTAAERMAADIADALAAPIDVGGIRLYTSASIGIAITPPLDANRDALLRAATAAMYGAKARGRARRCLFDDSMVRPWTERLALSNELHEALTEGALEVHYQPIVDLATGRLAGVEALVRWWHPVRQWVPPSLFVPLAEDRGLVASLDQWVLNRACRDTAKLRARGLLSPEAKVSINISAHSVADLGLLDRVRQSAEDAQLPFSALELEVTETGLMADAPRARGTLQALRALGVGIALDDFGTGYSSLIHLRQWPVSTIKVDRAFVEQILTRADDLAIAASIVDLGRAIGLRTVAEGVENPEQLALLHRLGCTSGQGYLWSPAVGPDDLASLLAGHPQGFDAAPADDDGPQRRGRRRAAPATNEHGLHLIQRMHRDGASLSTISAALNAEGYQTPVGIRWHSSSVARVIADIAYHSKDGRSPLR